MLKSLSHTGLVVRDIEASLRSYSEILCMRKAGHTERQQGFVEPVLAYPNAQIRGGFVDIGEGHQLEPVQYISPRSGSIILQRNNLGPAHLAFFVKDIDRFHEDTRRKGLQYNNLSAPIFHESGNPSRKACYARDSDSN